IMALIAAAVERSRSVSSIRSSILPPWRRANSQLNKAVRPPPMWRKPVGEGAKRVTTGSVIERACITVPVNCVTGLTLTLSRAFRHGIGGLMWVAECHHFEFEE